VEMALTAQIREGDHGYLVTEKYRDEWFGTFNVSAGGCEVIKISGSPTN